MNARILSLSAVVSLACACGGVSDAPPLPPTDSMTVNLSGVKTASSALTADGNWTQASVRVLLLDAWVVVGLAPEVAVFAAAAQNEPTKQGKNWVWSYQVKQGVVDATATLTAHMDGLASVWEMRIDGQVGKEAFADFLWYDGRYQVSTGYWQIYDRAGKVVRIDWTVNGPDDKQLKFTNNAGGADDGNFLDYKLAGDAASVSYDFQQNHKAEIGWSVSTTAGWITAADYVGHENQKACWDKDHVDVACQ